MRINSHSTSNDLHWHDGATCHGTPTLELCVEEAIKQGWVGKILKRVDTYPNGTTVACFSLVNDHYEHYAKQGHFVAEIKVSYQLVLLQ